MDAITKTLLGGAALCALATAPAMAGDAPALHLTALHGGNVVNKTRLHDPGRQHVTYTFGIYTSLAVVLDKKVNIPFFNYTWGNGGRKKFKVAPKKTACAKLGTYMDTTANGSVDYGVTYKLTNPDCIGGTDEFLATLIGWFENNGVKYKGTLNEDYNVSLYE